MQYGQKMMSIPDLSHMLVNVRVHEAFINHMEVDARVESVNADGPAEKAGIKPGDVVAKLGNKRVKGYADLVDALRSYKPGTSVKLTVQRGKEDQRGRADFGPAPRRTAGKWRRQPADSHCQSNAGRQFLCPSVTACSNDPNHAFGVQFQEGLPANVRVEAVAGKTLRRTSRAWPMSRHSKTGCRLTSKSTRHTWKSTRTCNT